MHQATIKRPSPEEVQTNDQLLKTFEGFFTSKNYFEIASLFHREGTYFEHFNYPALLAFFCLIFRSKTGIHNITGTFDNVFQTRQTLTEHFCIGINHGFSTDHQPGQVVVEFRFGLFDPFNHPEFDSDKKLSKELGDPCDHNLLEVVYRFALSFKDGKIFSLRNPKQFTKNLDKYTLEN